MAARQKCGHFLGATRRLDRPYLFWSMARVCPASIAMCRAAGLVCPFSAVTRGGAPAMAPGLLPLD